MQVRARRKRLFRKLERAELELLHFMTVPSNTPTAEEWANVDETACYLVETVEYERIFKEYNSKCQWSMGEAVNTSEELFVIWDHPDI
jgi:hypothetical protein